MNEWLKWIVVTALPAALVGCPLAGCGAELTSAHIKQMDVLRGMASDVTDRLDEGAAAQIAASGQALNPGIAVEASMVYRAVARYEGLAGQFQIGAHGVLGDRESRKRTDVLWTDTTDAERARRQLVRDVATAVVNALAAADAQAGDGR